MKKLILMTLLSVSAFTASASGVPDSTLNSIADYHRTNERQVALYKVLHGGRVNYFQVIVEIECNNGEYADWRIKQYNKAYIACETSTYENALYKIGIRPQDKPFNMHIADFLKISVAKKNGIKTIRENNTEVIDINHPELTVKKLNRLAYELELLVSK